MYFYTFFFTLSITKACHIITLIFPMCSSGPDDHVTRYDLSWLVENSYEGKKTSLVQPRVLWNADIYKKANVPSTKWDKFMSCDNEVKTFLQNYLLYGIAFVDDVPATVEATEAVTQRVSLIR